MFSGRGKPMELSQEVAVSSPSERRRFGQTVKARRSRVTNGRDILPGIDGRSAAARRYRDIAAAILIDQGGEDRCSESRKQLIRRFAAAAVLAELLEARLTNGERVDIAEHATLSSTLVRLAARIGIERVPQEVESLDQYLARHQPLENAADAKERASALPWTAEGHRSEA
jgi:hypothetical protein